MEKTTTTTFQINEKELKNAIKNYVKNKHNVNVKSESIEIDYIDYDRDTEVASNFIATFNSTKKGKVLTPKQIK